jgi:hypothetical protein
MAKTVFILGAGASKTAGAPLMSDFLEVAENLMLTDKVPKAKSSFEAVMRAQAELSSVHSKSQLQIHNVEDVFSAFEMANTLKKLGDYKPEDIENLVMAMKAVIVNTIEQTVAFPISGQYGIGVPSEYADFADLLTSLRENTTPKEDVAVVTFNYDMALDYAFYKARIEPSYGLENNPNPQAIPLLKLHGSLNWGECSQCHAIFPVYVEDYADPRGVIAFTRYGDADNVRFPFGSSIANQKHKADGAAALPEPVVIPPTWNKSGHYRGIANVWARAAQELSSAENIFIIGYSLPDSDSFFRYLYALGTVGRKILKRLWVFNPDESVKEKFRKMLGPGALQSFDYPLPPNKSYFHYSRSLIRLVLIDGMDVASAVQYAIRY